jgi:hypothetical protein
VFSGSNGHGEPRDETLDIRIGQLFGPRLQVGDETPDIRLRPAFSGSNGDGEPRNEALDIRIGQLFCPRHRVRDEAPDIHLRPVVAGRKTAT